MNSTNADRVFSGSIAQLYEQYMVPLIFDPYARDLTNRVVSLQPSAVLEVAAGTGVADKLPGFRVLDGGYMVEQISIAIPKGRDLGMTFLRQFIEDAKSEGLVASAAKRAGIRGTVKESK